MQSFIQRQLSVQVYKLPHTPKLVPDRGREDLGPDISKEAEEQVQLMRERLKTAQYRQKSYAATKRRTLTFAVGDFMDLRVSTLRGMQRFHVREKLAPDVLAKLKRLPVEEKITSCANFRVSSLRNLGDEILFKGGRSVTSQLLTSEYLG